MPSVVSQSIISNQRGLLSGTHRNGNITNSNVTSFSVSSIAIGSTPDPYRTVVVVSQANTTINSLNVNGVVIPSNQIITNTGKTKAIGWLSVPTGTTCTIGGNYVSGGDYRYLYCFTMTNGFRTMHDYKIGTSVTLDLPGDNTYVVAIGGGLYSNPTWTNLTARAFAVATVSGEYAEVASDLFTTNTTRTISISSGDMLVASFK